MPEKFNEDDLHELMGDREYVYHSGSHSDTDGEDEPDGWEGDDLGTLDLYGGELDWDRIADGLNDELEEEDPETCGCLDFEHVSECECCGHSDKCQVPQVRGCIGEDHSSFIIAQGSMRIEGASEVESESGELEDELQVIDPSPKPFDSLPTRDVENSGPRRHGAYWTKEEDEELLALFKSGLVMSAIADEHGRSEGAIQKRLLTIFFDLNGVKILGGQTSPEKAYERWTEEHDSDLESLKTRGATLMEMAEELDRSQRAVALRLVELRLVEPGKLENQHYFDPNNRNVLDPTRMRWTTAEYVELREAFYQGEPLASLAAITRRTEASCLMALVSRGEIKIDDLDKALQSALSQIKSSPNSQ